MGKEVPASNTPLEDRKITRVATPQRDRAKRELSPVKEKKSFSFSGWGKGRKK